MHCIRCPWKDPKVFVVNFFWILVSVHFIGFCCDPFFPLRSWPEQFWSLVAIHSENFRNPETTSTEKHKNTWKLKIVVIYCANYVSYWFGALITLMGSYTNTSQEKREQFQRGLLTPTSEIIKHKITFISCTQGNLSLPAAPWSLFKSYSVRAVLLLSHSVHVSTANRSFRRWAYATVRLQAASYMDLPCSLELESANYYKKGKSWQETRTFILWFNLRYNRSNTCCFVLPSWD